MKSLANCKPTEFLKQTSKIRKAVQKFLDITDVVKIYQRKAKLTPFRDDMTDEEKADLFAENRKVVEAQVRDNLNAILEEIMDKHPEETLTILALCCFVEPKNIDDHTVDEYLESFTELINNRAVMNFFTSLMRLEQMNISTASDR